MRQAFEVSIHTKKREELGTQCVVFADGQDEANAIGREVFGDRFFFAHNPAQLSDDMEVLHAGVQRRRGEREWLVRINGVEVHAYEQLDPMFTQVRFRANVPGFGAASSTLALAIRDAAGHFYKHSDPAWFTKSVAARKAYYPTSYAGSDLTT